MGKELSMEESFMNKLDDIIKNNLENENFGVNELAVKFGVSRSQLHRKLNAIKGKSTSQYIREFRLNRAMDMLKDNVANVSEIAYRVGFSSSTYFNTCFKDYYGYPPGEVKHKNENPLISIDSTLEVKKSNGRIYEFPTRKVGLFVIAFIGLLFIGFNAVKSESKTESNSVSAIKNTRSSSIAILPFKNLSADKESEYFATGVAQSIQNHLNELSGLKIISETSAAKYIETTKTSPEIAAELNVSHLLEASVQEYDDKVRVIVKLIDASKDQQIWSDIYDREMVDIFSIQSDISKQIARELEIVLSPTQIKQIDKKPTHNIEAYNLYQKGKHFFNVKNHSHATSHLSTSYFKQAIEKDPNFALAYAALANTYLFSDENLFLNNTLEYVTNLALKAIELDSSISEAHVVLGVLECQYKWDWNKAEKEFERAIKLNPNNSNAYIYYSQFLYSVKGDFNYARKILNKGLLLDPLSYVANLKSAQFYLFDDNFDKTFEETAKLKEINEHNMFAYWIEFKAYEALGAKNKAIAELETYFRKVPSENISFDELMSFYQLKGLNGVYEFFFQNNIKTFRELSNFNDFTLIADAQSYGSIGDTKNALKYLETALDNHCSYLYEIKYNPFLKDLHAEPRFLAILEEMNLEGYN
ncbi:helix-turn-helix domain-containing protein [Aurantibacter sp.]|uniref:helix-turn-helix domain-containing protein n=1 Tax=Aurantibacter sp. TaxID=2807103 RepID=UPI00326327CE